MRQAEQLMLSCQWDKPHTNTAHIQVTSHDLQCFQNNLWSVYTILHSIWIQQSWPSCQLHRLLRSSSFFCITAQHVFHFQIIRQKQRGNIQHLCLSKRQRGRSAGGRRSNLCGKSMNPLDLYWKFCSIKNTCLEVITFIITMTHWCLFKAQTKYSTHTIDENISILFQLTLWLLLITTTYWSTLFEIVI